MPITPVSVPCINRAALKILIVDDSSVSRTNIRSVLKSLGFTNFVEVSDGAQAIAMAASQTFHLIVTDYNLTQMDGLGLVNHFRQAPGPISVPILMVTAETEPIVLDAARNLGVAEIFGKDFAVDRVRPAIDKLFEPSATDT